MARKIRVNKWETVAICIVIIVFIPFFLMFLKHIVTQKDTWCTKTHTTDLNINNNPQTAKDYYDNGNYDYSIGNCQASVKDFSKSIEINPTAEALNNRAYSYMRMGDYTYALLDLDNALLIRPNYVNALMNRGDIYNFYASEHDKAIADYEKVISLGGKNNTSVCGHTLMARNGGYFIPTIIARFGAIITHLNNMREAGC